MTNIREGNFSVEQGIEDAQEFVCGGDNGFFMFHSLFPFPFVVDTKHLGVKDNILGYLIDCPAQMAVTSFGDFILTFEFSGFLNDWINACAGDDFFMGWDILNSWHFSDEVSGGKFTNTRHRSEDIHLFLMAGIYFFNEFWLEPSQFFFQFKKSFDATFQDFLSVIIVNTDGIVSYFYNFGGGESYFSAFATGNFYNDFGDSFLIHFSGDSCGRDFQQEFKHGFGEDVIFCSQFVEDIEGDLFDSVFKFGDFLGDYFIFSAEEFSGIGGGIVFDFVGVFEQEAGDGFCRDFVGSGFSQGVCFFEVFDQQGIEECDIIASIGKEIEDIDMVAAGGFNTDCEVLWVADGLQVFKDFVKSFFGLRESFLVDNFFFCVKDTEVQGIKGCIYADKIFIIRHGGASFFALNGLNNGNRMLSLPSSKVIRDLCPNQLIGNGESRGQTPSRALGPGRMSSPCFQSINFCGGLSSISSIIISILYPNST